MKQPPKHSPGPWVNDYFSIVDALDRFVCKIEFDFAPDSSCNYDAALIAEAPELLRVLDWAMETLKRTTPEASRGDCFYSAEQTLKRAKGDFL